MGNRKAREFQKQQEHASAWKTLQEIPRGIYEDVCLPGIGRRQLQLVVDPSFTPGYSWEIRASEAAWRLFRSEMVRGPVYGSDRLCGYTEMEASGVELRGFVDRLHSISLAISPPAEYRAGADGTTYHLALGDGLGAEARFCWWETPPSNWRPLGEIANEMIARFMGLAMKSA